MSRILLAYSSTDGHTLHICERLQQVMAQQGHAATLVPLAEADALDLSAFFSVNIVARKEEKSRLDSNPYLIKFLRQISWKPRLVDVFAGKLDYPHYRFFDRQMIRLIMLVTHGPIDPRAVIEFTDWQRVEAFGRQVCALS